MAKAEKSITTPDIAPDAGTVSAPKPELSAAEQKQLGANFLKAQKATEEAEAAYEKARAARSETIRALVDTFGHKGPFDIGGKLWSATLRKSSGFYSMSEQSGAKTVL